MCRAGDQLPRADQCQASPMRTNRAEQLGHQMGKRPTRGQAELSEPRGSVTSPSDCSLEALMSFLEATHRWGFLTSCSSLQKDTALGFLGVAMGTNNILKMLYYPQLPPHLFSSSAQSQRKQLRKVIRNKSSLLFCCLTKQRVLSHILPLRKQVVIMYILPNYSISISKCLFLFLI